MAGELVEDDEIDLMGDGEFDEADDGLDLAPADEPVTDEQRARAMGWKPFAEYRGDPRRWTDYPEFIRRGEEELPIIRDQNRRLSEKVARFEPELASASKAARDALALARASEQRGYDRALAEQKAAARQAVAEGNTEAYDDAQAEIDRIEAAKRIAAAPAQEEPPAPEPEREPIWPETQAFLDANPWFHTDAALAKSMIAYHSGIVESRPDLSRAAQYALAKKRVAEDFPGRIPGDQPVPRTDPPRQRRAMVLEPGGETPRERRGSVWDQIEDAGERADCRAAFTNMQRHDEGLTAEEYVSLYLNPKQDVIALRAKRKK